MLIAQNTLYYNAKSGPHWVPTRDVLAQVFMESKKKNKGKLKAQEVTKAVKVHNVPWSGVWAAPAAAPCGLADVPQAQSPPHGSN